MTSPIPALPEAIELGIVQGQTYSLTVTWTDGAATPTPLSMTGRYAHMSIAKKVGGVPVIDSYSGYITKGVDDDNPDDQRLATASVADILQEPNSRTGVLVVRLPATATAALTKQAYTFDLYTINSTDPTDAVQLATGTVAVLNSTTTALLVEPS